MRRRRRRRRRRDPPSRGLSLSGHCAAGTVRRVAGAGVSFWLTASRPSHSHRDNVGCGSAWTRLRPTRPWRHAAYHLGLELLRVPHAWTLLAPSDAARYRAAGYGTRQPQR
jgi:hypothetical protein